MEEELIFSEKVKSESVRARQGLGSFPWAGLGSAKRPGPNS